MPSPALKDNKRQRTKQEITLDKRINTFKAVLNKWSRYDWVARLLNLPCPPVEDPAPGMVLIQVDGLSHRQFMAGLNKTRLPFLNQCIKNGKCRLKPFYSGLPSTTPAVQAELFFGKRTAVPAFEFYDRFSGKKHVMFYPGSADKIAESLHDHGEPLLKNGRSYSNIYTAGADEGRYCIQTMDLESFVKSVRLTKSLFIFTLYFSKIFKMLGYAILEFCLALVDFFRGIAQKRNFIKELKFIPTRVFFCIVLRELIRFRVKMDIQRGVPIIHANFLAYDEQAHRRGPDSRFAHWSLKGIDDAIRDIHRASRSCPCRNYRLIVYSDHGQEKVESYQKRFGKDPIETVTAILTDSGDTASAQASPANLLLSSHYQRRSARWFFGGKSQKKVPAEPVAPDQIHITTTGPVGHVYLPSPLPSVDLAALAERLVKEAHMPLVLYVDKNRVYGMNRQGTFNLRTQNQWILGHDHAFKKWAAEDLEKICRHPFAGDLVISGWSPHDRPLSFSLENGAHGGPGNQETCGFILLPVDMAAKGRSLRPLDLRRMVMNLLGDMTSNRKHHGKDGNDPPAADEGRHLERHE